jgi:hypothetical protein
MIADFYGLQSPCRVGTLRFCPPYDAAIHQPSRHCVNYETDRRPLPAVRHLTYCIFIWPLSLPTFP